MGIPITGRAVAKGVYEKLGIPCKGITKIEIIIAMNDAVRVIVHRLVEKEELDGVLEVLPDPVIVERKIGG
jgi:hypothetical protein